MTPLKMTNSSSHLVLASFLTTHPFYGVKWAFPTDGDGGGDAGQVHYNHPEVYASCVSYYPTGVINEPRYFITKKYIQLAELIPKYRHHALLQRLPFTTISK